MRQLVDVVQSNQGEDDTGAGQGEETLVGGGNVKVHCTAFNS